MPAPLRVALIDLEDLTLAELREATTVPQRTRYRAHMIRLNAQGWNVPAIAKIFECHEHTVRATLRHGRTWDWGDCGNLKLVLSMLWFKVGSKHNVTLK